MSDLLAELAGIVGPAHVLTAPEATAVYTVDWSGRFLGITPAVVRPGSTDEVAAVIAACGRIDAAIVPQGGNTGLVGGGVPLGGEIVLSLRRLAPGVDHQAPPPLGEGPGQRPAQSPGRSGNDRNTHGLMLYQGISV